MQIISKDMAAMLIENDPNATCVISKYNDGADTGYILHSTLEERDNLDEYPLGYIMNGYGKSGWFVTKQEMDENLEASGNSLIDAIVEQQGHVAGDMYLFDEEPMKDYLNPETYNVDELIYIYAINEEIVSWLPYLTHSIDNCCTVAYCFIIQPMDQFREKYFREQEHAYFISDAKYAVNEYFGLSEDEVPSEELNDEDELDEYNYCMSHLEDIVTRFEKYQNTETGDYYAWQEAISVIIDEKRENENESTNN